MVKKLLRRYQMMPIQVKASIWFIVCSAVQNGCKFLTMPILVRLLTTEQYGIYSVFLSWTSILSILVTLNLHAGVYNNAMFKFPDRRSEYTSASQSLAMVITLALFCLYLPFSRYVDALFGLEHKLVILAFLQLFFTEGFLLWSTRQRYEYRYVPLLICTVLLTVFYTAIPVIAAYYSMPGIRLYVLAATGVIVQVIFGSAFIIYNYAKRRRFCVWEFWRYALRFNIPLIPHYLSGVILGQADRVMIKKYIGSSEAGIYSFVYTISIAANIITGAVNNAVIPYTYEKMKKKEYADLRAVSKTLLLIIGSLVILLSLFAPEIIYIIATEEYYSAVYLVPIIASSVYFTFLYSLFGNIEFYFGANRFIAVASVSAATTNIVLNYILLPKFGYYAAGYTTLICYMLLSIAHYAFMRLICSRRIGAEHVYDDRRILAISLGVMLVSTSVMLIYKHAVIRYLLVITLLAVCVCRRTQLMAFGTRLRKKDR